jgi:hypothetical protein
MMMDLNYNLKIRRELKRETDPLLRILTQVHPQNTCGLSGGDARDFLCGYNHPQGASGIDIFIDGPIDNHALKEALLHSLGIQDRSVALAIDNLAIPSPVPDISLALFSYFHTPGFSLSKTVVMQEGDRVVVYDYGNALRDLEEKVLRLDFEEKERVLTLAPGAVIQLGPGDVITRATYNGDAIHACIGHIDEDGFSEAIAERTMHSTTPPSSRYGSLDWKQVAKLCRVAILYAKEGFAMDDVTEHILQTRLRAMTVEERRSAVEFVCYKIHSNDLAQFPELATYLKWFPLLFSSETTDIVDGARIILQRYQTAKKVFFAPEDNIFQRKKEIYYAQ